MAKIPNLEDWKRDMIMRRKGFRADFSPNFAKAVGQLRLTHQEQNLYRHHLKNLSKGGVSNPDESISTLYQIVQEHNGRYYNLPTVWDNKIVDRDTAYQRALDSGIHRFPSYGSEQEADKRYSDMHKYLEADMAGWFDQGPPKYPPFRYGVGPGMQLREE